MADRLAYYEVLGLDAPPADRKAVKRAYSKMLKVTRPEDDPDGFMRLRDAHDMALNIITRNAENAAWEAERALYTAQPTENSNSAPAALVSELDASPEPSLTYEDLLPEYTTAPDTSYAIGPTPNLDAPVMFSEPEEPKAPPLIAELNNILDDPHHYNDREKWNILFRKARQLDIDDYVDFEHLLLERILHFHGYYYDNNPLFNTPEKMVQKLSPSIAASLFKTMSWDQVNKQGYHRGQQVEWLERRMQMRKRRPDAVPVPETESGGFGNVWLFLFFIFIGARLLIYFSGG